MGRKKSIQENPPTIYKTKAMNIYHLTRKDMEAANLTPVPRKVRTWSGAPSTIYWEKDVVQYACKKHDCDEAHLQQTLNDISRQRGKPVQLIYRKQAEKERKEQLIHALEKLGITYSWDRYGADYISGRTNSLKDVVQQYETAWNIQKQKDDRKTKLDDEIFHQGLTNIYEDYKSNFYRNKDEYLSGNLTLKEFIRLIVALAERKRLLLKALRRMGLELRNDSRLCKGYIEGTIHKSIPEIVHRMCEVKYLFDYRNMRTRLDQYNKKRRKFRFRDSEYYEFSLCDPENFLDSEESYPRVDVFAEVEKIILREKPYPARWPWMGPIQIPVNTTKPKPVITLKVKKVPQGNVSGSEEKLNK